MNNTQHASDPQRNITVTASAGTGKTYLLITRLLRILLADTPPETILAITFTRKAAAEMQQRITERLHELLLLSPSALDQQLEAMGITPNETVRHRSQTLYERLLRCEQPLRITTFHAFCQEILRRFPLEADVPPGFEILDSSGLLEKRALDALFNDATQAPNGELATMVERVMSHCGSIKNSEVALKQFLQHRSDWWAFIDHQHDPISGAAEQLAAQLDIEPSHTPDEADFLTAKRVEQLQQFYPLLIKHKTGINATHAALLQQVLDETASAQQRITHIRTIFLTSSGEPRKRKASKTQCKSMGDAGQVLFLEIHQAICDGLLELKDQLNRHQLYRGSVAWYHVGSRLLHHYQTMKEEQRLLDFADLEWRAYQLLNHHNSAHWIQYKLDQRINHLLVDEFQDTNPTQWRMLLPLLQELASGENERNRSVFLVGDSKQSIYRFRRADPELFTTAQQWLAEHLNAETQPLDISWRSAPAIIDFVNRTFENTPLGARLTDFQHHDTHQKQLWGKVEMVPLVTVEENEGELNKSGNSPGIEGIEEYLSACDIEPTAAEFRNPLKQPRITRGDNWQQHYREGCIIAARIQSMTRDGTAIEAHGELRTLQLNDIIILIRNRTHLSAYEAALREQGIAYVSNTKSTVLDTLEAQDMVALLNTLISPHNNLLLAQVLRSPLFGCNDESLMLLASMTAQQQQRNIVQPWFTSLGEIEPLCKLSEPLARAHQLIKQWQQYAGALPAHDLLDRVFHEANLQQRYAAAFPPHLRARVASNLTRFIELALEIDSGRYPSLPHFINRLKKLKEHAPSSIDEPVTVNSDGAVRIMTIHAAKGLEAPVVFIADAARSTTSKRAHHAIVNWPSEQPAPTHFFLCGAKDTLDQSTASLLDSDDQEAAREDANLLYVALTRARQHLIITGCIPKKGKDLGWYGAISQQLMDKEAIKNNSGFEMSSGTLATIAPTEVTAKQSPPPSTSTAAQTINSALSLPTEQADISPSDTAQKPVLDSTAPADEDGSARGATIHRILELITDTNKITRACVTQHITEEFGEAITSESLNQWLDEAYTLINTPSLMPLFDASQFHTAHNEMPIHFHDAGHRVAGIIDRLVVTDSTVVIIDYKTHRNVNHSNMAHYAEQYRSQMSLYQRGVEQIWPEKKVTSLLLFTSAAYSYHL